MIAAIDSALDTSLGARNTVLRMARVVIENVSKILETLPRDQTDRALASVGAFKKTMQSPHEFSEAAFRKIDSEIWDLRVATLGEAGTKRCPSIFRSRKH